MTKRLLYFVLCPFVLFMTSCEPRALTEEDVIVREDQLLQALADENPDGQYTIYNLNDLLDTYANTEKGNFMSDSSLYRTRSSYNSLQLFSIDTLPTNGPGIYIRGRVATDDYGGNFYKTLVIQQTTDWKTGNAIEQQAMRISVDMGSVGGMFQQGQEIIIRCNGLALGRYANQPQLCVPSYNNNIYAQKAEEKTGWAPGRIPSADFRRATRMIGLPDKSKIVYETMTLAQLEDKYLSKFASVPDVRKMDGTLVKILDVHYTCTYDSFDLERQCRIYDPIKNDTLGSPEDDKYACTFGPTTFNVNHPQSRYVKDASEQYKVLVSASEYARYAYYYLPAAKYVGSITGVLSYYYDNGNYAPTHQKWAITPCSINDILPECQKEGANPRWIPVEWKRGEAQVVE